MQRAGRHVEARKLDFETERMRAIPKHLSPVLLAVLIGAACTASAARAYSLSTWSWNESITIKLTDGRTIEGRYRGVFGRSFDPAKYPDRYEAWRAKLGPAAPPALGETLLVAREAGGQVRGPLRGFANHALLIGTDDSCVCFVVPLDKHGEAVLVTGAAATGTAAHRRWKSAPSLYVVSLQVDGTSVAVPVSMVASRSMLPPAGSNPSLTPLVGVLVAAVLLSGAAIAAAASAFNQPMI